jgi:predicted NUDIX family NTP pyrophosphohydrolase
MDEKAEIALFTGLTESQVSRKTEGCALPAVDRKSNDLSQAA